MKMEEVEYRIPLALTIISIISLALGAIFALIVTADIIHRRGWRSMMHIMIPVYIINATYLGPIDLFIYYRFGRPSKPPSSITTTSHHRSCHTQEKENSHDIASSVYGSEAAENPTCHGALEQTTQSENNCCSHKAGGNDTRIHEVKKPACHSKTEVKSCHGSSHGKTDPEDLEAVAAAPHHACHSTAGARPYWATVLVGVSHCGAGCVLGDLVGEWLVYGTDASINGHGIWAELLIDYAFALLFGIFFQYFSIAPMSGEWGPMTVIRAAKADVLSLTSFEVGAFGWMIAYQVGIFGYRLSMDTWLYWWMMQIGMCLGVATAFPVNWWLLKAGIKEPCC